MYVLRTVCKIQLSYIVILIPVYTGCCKDKTQLLFLAVSRCFLAVSRCFSHGSRRVSVNMRRRDFSCCLAHLAGTEARSARKQRRRFRSLAYRGLTCWHTVILKILNSKTNSAKNQKSQLFWFPPTLNLSKSTFSNSKKKDFFSRCSVLFHAARGVAAACLCHAAALHARARGGTLEF